MTPTPSMRQALEWTAAALQALADGTLSDSSTFTISGVKRSIREILDEADAALGAPREQPQQQPLFYARHKKTLKTWEILRGQPNAETLRTGWIPVYDAPPPPTHPENIRAGQPYDDPAFEQLAREYAVWGTAQSALCAVFWWGAREQDAEQERDAERYRWIRGPDQESTRYSRWRVEYWDGPNGWQPVQRESMDAAIDAARAQRAAAQGDA